MPCLPSSRPLTCVPSSPPPPQGSRPGQSCWKCSVQSSRCVSSGAARVPAAARPGAMRSLRKSSLPCPTSWSLLSALASCDPGELTSLQLRAALGAEGFRTFPRYHRNTVIGPRMFWVQLQDPPCTSRVLNGLGIPSFHRTHTHRVSLLEGQEPLFFSPASAVSHLRRGALFLSHGRLSVLLPSSILL